ncbi:MAG: UvrD-helicase domain-containing protein, partial [Gemmatimonadetes bacterium]|nr:UvrD-helicase domain-containing protein [Gemmatimonadota bacterium]
MTQLSLFPPAAVPASPPGVSGAAGQLGDAAAEVGAAAAGLLPDQAARDRIRSDLETSLLVEAGAGAGKTTEMVGRMVALVRCDKARVDQLAAVTFTRKAAAELRQRFQVQLEVELRRAQKSGDGPVLERVDRALKELDRGFIGTIHSFCARLLRERPLEAGLDPAFRELQAVEADRLARDFWMRHLERLAAQGDALLLRAAELGMRPGALFGLFRQLSDNPDVAFPGHPFEAPDPEALRAQLEQLLDRAIALLPEAEPRGGWDAFQTRLRSLRFHRALGWHERARLFEALAELQGANFGVRRERWGADPARAQSARELAGELAALAGPGGPVERLLQQWYAHRYPYALELALRAAAAFSAERRRSGRLDFQDLLMLAARLLREHPAARRALAERYPCLLVDEFQDTDPIQAEVLFLLAARDPDAQDWRLAEPRAGALFVVGDPKQSIYRFRRADIAIYNQVKRRFQEWGAVVELTSNFRSTRPIEQFVNQVFAARFPAQATDHQAAFAWLRAVRPDPAPEGGRGAEVVGGAVQAATRARVCWYEFPAPASTRQQLIAAEDAELVASWIHERIEQGERRPGDFLVLTQRKGCLAIYARALEARNLPVQVTGGGIGIEEELEELARLLRALADPGDPTLTVAVLTGLFFGLDHEQLAEHALAGSGFRFDVPPAAPPGTPVQQALGTLHEFWQWTRSQPADAAVAAIVDHL